MFPNMFSSSMVGRRKIIPISPVLFVCTELQGFAEVLHIPDIGCLLRGFLSLRFTKKPSNLVDIEPRGAFRITMKKFCVVVLSVLFVRFFVRTSPKSDHRKEKITDVST